MPLHVLGFHFSKGKGWRHDAKPLNIISMLCILDPFFEISILKRGSFFLQCPAIKMWTPHPLASAQVLFPLRKREQAKPTTESQQRAGARPYLIIVAIYDEEGGQIMGFCSFKEGKIILNSCYPLWFGSLVCVWVPINPNVCAARSAGVHKLRLYLAKQRATRLSWYCSPSAQSGNSRFPPGRGTL